MIVTRKIKVVGCLNCPYRKEIRNLIDNVPQVINECRHPSFNHKPKLNNEYIENLKEGKEHSMVRNSYTPDWCPLEIESYVCCCNPVN